MYKPHPRRPADDLVDLAVMVGIAAFLGWAFYLGWEALVSLAQWARL